MSWYRTGVISLANNTTVVTGVGTAFTTETKYGDIFICNSVSGNFMAQIVLVVSDTQIKLDKKFNLPSVVSHAYEIIVSQPSFSSYDLNEKINTLLAVPGLSIQRDYKDTDLGGLTAWQHLTHRYVSQTRNTAGIYAGEYTDPFSTITLTAQGQEATVNWRFTLTEEPTGKTSSVLVSVKARQQAALNSNPVVTATIDSKDEGLRSTANGLFGWNVTTSATKSIITFSILAPYANARWEIHEVGRHETAPDLLVSYVESLDHMGVGVYPANRISLDNYSVINTPTGATIDGIITADDYAIPTLTSDLAGKLDNTANAVSSAKWATARTITLSGDLTGSVSINGSANVTLSASVKDDSHNHIVSNVDGLQAGLDAKENLSAKGVANGYAGLDATGKVPTNQLPDSVTGTLEYQGTWNASTNTPAIPAGSAANKGHYYKVNVAGATLVNGVSDWGVGDWIVSDGVNWDIIDNTDLVSSVAGKVGAVTLNKNDVGLSNVENTTDLQKVISTATGIALGLKAPLASPALTGTPTAPTVGVTINTSQIATTAFVQAVVANELSPYSTTLDGLADTTITTIATGDLLVRIGTVWINASPAEAGVQPLTAALTGTQESFTTALFSKLNLIEAGATQDQTKADIDALGVDASTLDGVDSTGFVRTDVPSTIAGNNLLTFGPNTSSKSLSIGGSGTPTAALATVKVSNGNLHVDAAVGFAAYMNWYGGTAGTIFGNGLGVQVAKIDAAGNFTLSGTVDGRDVAADGTKLDTHAANTTNPHAVTKAQVGLSNANNTSDANKPVSNATQAALDLKVDTSAISGYATLASPTFTGTVNGITKAMVGLGSVDNTADSAKPVSTAQAAIFSLKAPLESPSFSGTVSGITKAMVGLGSVDNTSDADKPVSTAQAAAIALKATATSVVSALADKAPLASPTFTGTVNGITKAMVGLGNADNTSDTNKPVSSAQQTALDAKLDATKAAVDGLKADAGTLDGIDSLGFLQSANLSTRAIADANAADNRGVTVNYLASGATNKPTGTDHSLLTLSYSNAWSTQMASDWRTNEWYVRNQNNSVWGNWVSLLHTGNFKSGVDYQPAGSYQPAGDYQPLDAALTGTTASFTAVLKTKLDGLSNYAHPADHAISVITGLQDALDAKTDTVTGTTNQVTVTAGSNKDVQVSLPTNVTISGTLSAAAKSFLIPHPTRSNHSLRHGSLEGPENGVYFRGRCKASFIQMPAYWWALVDLDTITVQLTHTTGSASVTVGRIKDHRIEINKSLISRLMLKKVDCFYTITAERKDIAKLIVEEKLESIAV